jgi:two-component system, OmpR family, KDP operon response regulator KdpE
MTAVLVADPDSHARRMATTALRLAGYTVETTAAPGRIGPLLRRRRPDALILDPVGTSLVETVSALRAQTDIPILVVSATASEWDKVAALDAGADDYLTKPIGVEELLARLRVVFRRTPPAETPREEPVTTDDFVVHLADRRWVTTAGAEVRLTPTEWRFVEILLRHAGHLVTQAELLRGVWGPKALEKSHYLRVQIAGIRRKVEPDPAHPRYFITAPGLGFRFDTRPTYLTADGPGADAGARQH